MLDIVFMYSVSVMSSCEDQHGSSFSKARFLLFDSADTHVNDGVGKTARSGGPRTAAALLH